MSREQIADFGPKPAKCDGNHGGPRCADPECWNDDAQAVETEALRDMLDSARADLEVIRQALGVPVEPHQSLMERMVEAACARAMVQPDIAEVERLVLRFESAAAIANGPFPYASSEAHLNSARNALLDAVRAIVAERDALRHDVERLMQIVSREVSK